MVKVEEKVLVDLLWSCADLARDKMGIELNNVHNVVLPITILKRILDQREDYINKNFKTLKPYKDGKVDLLSIYNSKSKSLNDIYRTKTPEMFFITYQDIINFSKNKGSEEIKLSIDSNIKIKNSSKLLWEFIQEVSSSFEHRVLHDVLIDSDFLKVYLTNTKKISNVNLINLVDEFNGLHFGDNIKEDIFSLAYMDLIAKFASGSGKKGGEFFTPDKICNLACRLLDVKLPEKGNYTISDMTGGSATFLTTLIKVLKEQDNNILDRLRVLIQELTGSSLLMGEVGLLLGGTKMIETFNANTISEYTENIGQYRKKVDIVVGNPPYGLKNYGYEYALANQYSEPRWDYGVPKKGEGEYAFIQTAIDLMNDKGKAALVLPLGTLFKDSTKEARKRMLQDDIIEGIIVLPGDMFQTTGIPTCIWIFNKNKKKEDKNKVFKVDKTNTAWKEGKYNTIDYDKAIDMFVNRKVEEGYSGYVDIKDIEENEWNLSVQRYIFKDEPEEEIDIVELVDEIKELETEIENQKSELDGVFLQILSLEETK